MRNTVTSYVNGSMINLATWPLLLVSLSFLLSAWDTVEVSAEPEKVRPVKLFVVTNQHSGSVRQFPAVVEPTKRANLTFRVNGKLTSLTGRPSNNVEQGQVLAQLDDTDFKLRLDQASARYELAQTQFNRAELLNQQKLISQAQFDETKAQELVEAAHKVCPYSNATRGNVDARLHVTVV